VSAGGCGGSAPRRAGPPDPTVGKRLFVSAGCGACHALRAAGTSATIAKPLDAAPLAFAHIVEVVREGGAEMPAYSGALDARQIADIAAFVSRASHS
jgi:mono/diheme cytochrome c family protein